MMTLPTCWPTRARRLTLATVLACAFVGESASPHNVDDEFTSEWANATDARGLLQAFRETGEDRYLDDAWALLERELSPNASANVLIDAALVAQARHRFDDARMLTAKAIELGSANDQAWLLVNSIALVQGRADEAADACRQLRNSPPLVIVTCHARVALISGNEASVLPRLEAMLSLGSSDDVLLAWSQSIAGDLAAARGKDTDSIRHYRASLGLAESTQVRSALVDALFRTHRLAEARHALDAGSHHALPLEVRRLIADRIEGHDSHQRIDHVDQRFREWIVDSDWLHAREMARFYLDVKPDPELAHKLAGINIGIQKEPEDYRLLRRAYSLEARHPGGSRIRAETF
ncbi:MAG TPA: hypothetical protein VIV14_11830 [Gammaproteobacteria bacterium]